MVVGVLRSGSPIPMRRCRSGSHACVGNATAVLQHHDFHFSRVVARLRPDVNLQARPFQGCLAMQLSHPESEKVIETKPLLAYSLSNKIVPPHLVGD